MNGLWLLGFVVWFLLAGHLATLDKEDSDG